MFNWLRKLLQEKDAVVVGRDLLDGLMDNPFEMFLDTQPRGVDQLLKSERNRGKMSNRKFFDLIGMFMRSKEYHHKYMRRLYKTYLNQIELIFRLQDGLKK